MLDDEFVQSRPQQARLFFGDLGSLGKHLVLDGMESRGVEIAGDKVVSILERVDR